MSTVTVQPVLSPTNNQRYGFSFDSIYNTQKPQIVEDYLKYYGSGIGVLGLSTLAGNIINIAGSSKTAYEEGAFTKLVELNGAIAPAGAGVNITFRLAAAEYDLNGACYLNTNEILVIPAEYMTEGGANSTIPHGYQVIGNDGGVGALRLYTARPMLATQVLAIAVPNTTQLMVRGGNYALESASGTGKSSGWYHRHFFNSIKKWDWAYGGGTQSTERWIEHLKGGFQGIISKITMEADHQLDMQVDDEILLSTGVTNAALTMNNRNGNAIPVTATEGVLRHLEQRACRQYYTAAYQMSDFDDLKDILNSQGVTERNVLILLGSSLYQQIENSSLDFVKEFSGGTDFMKKLAEINVVFKAINKNGVYTTFKELPPLQDPTRYAAASFNGYFGDLGILIPEVDVTVTGAADTTPVKLRNLTLGFRNYNGENRTRIIKDLPSVAGQGNIALDTFDDSRGTMLTEFSLLFHKVNQAVLIQNDNIL
jgi:hypothetical protein